jgi:hypothetical protein
MKNVNPEVSDILLDVGCPIGVCESDVEPKRVQNSPNPIQLILFPGDATNSEAFNLLFLEFGGLP